jgi:polysaccharide export outer membrane protein
MNRFHFAQTFRRLLALLVGLLLLAAGSTVQAQSETNDYTLGAGDAIRVQVFQNPELTLETRVPESGVISYPLIGAVKVGGTTVAAAERKIADALQSGGFLQRPQVTILLTQLRGAQVSVLGQVGRPGRFVLETANTRLSDILASAGGTTATGDDLVTITGTRDGKPFRKTVDLPALFQKANPGDDLVLQGGDVVFVDRAPVFYIYGEANRPGAFRIERGMTVMQALAQGGGPTVRGSQERLVLHRRQADGSVAEIKPALTDPVQANDVIFVRASIF